MDDFLRYLAAKRTVDDRALNLRVWNRLREELSKLPGERVPTADVGAGIGTGGERIGDWALLEPISRIRYTAVEPRGELLEEARRRLASAPFETEFEATDLAEYSSRPENAGRFAVVTAQALLDIVELDAGLDGLTRLVREGGLLHLPITFDGETIFEPSLEADGEILEAYHRTMRRSGRTGRIVYHALVTRGLRVLEAGSSDWIVRPTGGGYPGDEGFFLRFVLRTIEGSLRDRVDPRKLDAWIEARHGQIEDRELFYCAHQMDFLAKKE